MKKVLSLILAVLIVFNTFSITPLCLVSAIETANTKSDYIYYSDLFYGYSSYLKSNKLMDYNRETYATMSNVFSEYVKSDAFELAGFSETLNLFSNMSELAKAYSDLFGITDFQYKDDLDKANKEFVIALFEMDIQTLQDINNQGVIPKQISGVSSLLEDMHKTIAESEDEINYKNFINNYLTKGDVFFSEIRSVPSLTSRAYEYLETIAGTAGMATKIYNFTAALLISLAMEDVRLELISDIIRTQEKDTILYEGMSRLYSQIEDGFLNYFIDTYFESKIIDSVFDKVTDKATSLITGDVGSIVSLITAGAGLVNTIVFDWIAGDYIPSFSDYRVTMILAQYSDLMYRSLLQKQEDFKKAFTIDQISEYETFFNAYLSATECAIDKCADLASCNVDFPPIYVVSNFSKWDDFDYSKYTNDVKTQIKLIPESERLITDFGTWSLLENTVFISGSDNIENGKMYLTKGCFNADIRIYRYKLTIPENIDVTINGNIDGDNGTINNNGILHINGNINSRRCYFRMHNSNAVLTISGDMNFDYDGAWSQWYCEITDGTVILNGTEQQTVAYLNAKDIIINNLNGVKYEGMIGVSGHYNPNGNPIIHNGYTTQLYEGASLEGGNDYGNIHISYADLIFDESLKINDVTFSSQSVGSRGGKITILEGVTVELNGSLSIPAYSYVTNYGTLNIDGNIGVSSGTFNNHGTLTINGNVNGDNGTINNNSIMHINGNINSRRCYFKMHNPNAVLTASGNMNFDYNSGWASWYCEITDGTVILNGTEQQTVAYLKAPLIIIENESEEGVVFNSKISSSVLFNHNGNNFTLYNGGSGSTFVDYDGDGLKDNVDPTPVLYNPVGDADYNGTVNSADLVHIRKILLEKIILNTVLKTTSDINLDGNVDVRDLVRLKKKLAGIIA